MDLLERAERVRKEVNQALSSAGAMMIPSPIKGIIQQQAQIMEDQAREIARLGDVLDDVRASLGRLERTVL